MSSKIKKRKNKPNPLCIHLLRYDSTLGYLVLRAFQVKTLEVMPNS